MYYFFFGFKFDVCVYVQKHNVCIKLFNLNQHIFWSNFQPFFLSMWPWNLSFLVQNMVGHVYKCQSLICTKQKSISSSVSILYKSFFCSTISSWKTVTMVSMLMRTLCLFLLFVHQDLYSVHATRTFQKTGEFVMPEESESVSLPQVYGRTQNRHVSPAFWPTQDGPSDGGRGH